jgi:outer membrane protein
MKKLSAIAALSLACAIATPAYAFETGDWFVKLGAHAVNPDSDNGSLADGALAVDIDTNWRPSITAEYFFSPNLGLEVLAALPFEHDVKLNGADAATVRHLPPTVTLQYHFNTAGKFRPFVGAGINYTWIYDESTRGPIDGADLDLDNSWGLAAHLGFDVKLDNDWYVGADLRWIDIDSDARVDGVDVGTVNIDPLAYGVYVGWTF